MSNQQEAIILFVGVEILPNLTMAHAKEYLNRYCAIDTLGNTLYVKKIGNDQTTFKIEFNFNKILLVRKTHDEKGIRLDDEPIFERDYDVDSDNDDIDYDDI